MSYIGVKPTIGNFQICDAISVVNGQAAYTMQVGSVNVSPQSANHMIVSLNSCIQKPNSSFTVSGSTITFASNLVTNDVIDFIQILGDVLDLGVPSDATVTTAKLADDAVTSAKITDANITSAKIAGGVLKPPHRNLIINGDMSVAQRATSVTGVGNGDNSCHTVDRLSFYEEGATSGEFTMSQDTDVPTGYGFAKSTKFDCTTADASLAVAEVFALEYKFEGLHLQHLKKGTSNAESLTLSFWVKTNKTGTYVANFYDNDNDRHTSQNYTVSSSNTWEKKTITFAPDTSGTLTNDNTLALAMYFILGAGTSYTSGSAATAWETFTGNADNWCGGQNVNVLDHTDNNFWITGVQLEIGTAASDFEFVPYDVNLQRCQRYFQTYTVMGTMGARNTTDVEGSFEFHTPMRSSPSASQSTAKVFRDMYGGTFTQSSAAISIVDSSDKGLFVGMGNLSSLTQGRIMCATSGTSQFSSEL